MITRHSNSADTKHDVIVDSPVKHLIQKPMRELDELISALSMTDRQEYERRLSGLCVQAARFVGYLEARGTLGCGDHGHGEAVKNSNKLATKVRRALGYTQAKADISF